MCEICKAWGLCEECAAPDPWHTEWCSLGLLCDRCGLTFSAEKETVVDSQAVCPVCMASSVPS